MLRFFFKAIAGAILCLGLFAQSRPAHAQQPAKSPDPLIGMYIHQHWAYNHPYSARTWTYEEWVGYLNGLKSIGFNFVMIWPMLETMPNPLLSSDVEHLEKLARVIDYAQKELGFKVIVVLCGNVAAVDEIAARQSFYERNYFYVDYRFNPADAEKLAEIVAWRGKLLSYLKHADGVSIIDADPSGYPDSPSEEFTELLAAHRPMLDSLRQGITLYYWVNCPWVSYNRFYKTGKFAIGSPDEFKKAMKDFADKKLEPWGFLGNSGVHQYANEVGLGERFITLTYGVIEYEPSFPLTRYGIQEASSAASQLGPLGTMGNAQSHVLQLPNTFAFARGAHHQPVSDADLGKFAEDLIPGQGAQILAAWKAIAGTDAAAAEAAVAPLKQLDLKALKAGPLKGLIFSDPQRYVEDLILQLQVRSTLQHFLAASREQKPLLEPLGQFVEAVEAWQLRHGYPNRWKWEELEAELKKVDHAGLKAALADNVESYSDFTGVKTGYFREETATPRLLRALKAWYYELKTGYAIPADGGIPQRRP